MGLPYPALGLPSLAMDNYITGLRCSVMAVKLRLVGLTQTSQRDHFSSLGNKTINLGPKRQYPLLEFDISVCSTTQPPGLIWHECH